METAMDPRPFQFRARRWLRRPCPCDSHEQESTRVPRQGESISESDRASGRQDFPEEPELVPLQLQPICQSFRIRPAAARSGPPVPIVSYVWSESNADSHILFLLDARSAAFVL